LLDIKNQTVKDQLYEMRQSLEKVFGDRHARFDLDMVKGSSFTRAGVNGAEGFYGGAGGLLPRFLIREMDSSHFALKPLEAAFRKMRRHFPMVKMPRAQARGDSPFMLHLYLGSRQKSRIKACPEPDLGAGMTGSVFLPLNLCSDSRPNQNFDL
jgi:hypothetical protein